MENYLILRLKQNLERDNKILKIYRHNQNKGYFLIKEFFNDETT